MRRKAGINGQACEIVLDAEDMEFLRPLVETARAGRRAESVIQAYIGAIKRRSGISVDRQCVLDVGAGKIIVSPPAAER
jgi:hypothetical protein